MKQVGPKKARNRRLSLKTKLSPTWQLICASLLFIVSVIASRGADMHPWEIDLFNNIYDRPEYIHPLVFVVTQAGTIHVLAILLIIAFLIKNYALLTKLLMTSTLAFLLSGFAKDIWGRIRPNEVIVGVENLDYIVRGPGFPSGHMALATAMALVINNYLPKRLRWITWIWIIGVGYSRVYLGIHAPLDIVGGFAIGWLSYSLIKHLYIRNIISIKKKPDRDNGKK